MIFDAFGVALAQLALNGQISARVIGRARVLGWTGQDNRQARLLVRRRIAPPPFAPPFASRSRRVANVFAMGERLPRALFD